jgi:hypothetical protein
LIRYVSAAGVRVTGVEAMTALDSEGRISGSGDVGDDSGVRLEQHSGSEESVSMGWIKGTDDVDKVRCRRERGG